MQPMNRYGFKAKTIAEMGLGQWDRVEYFGAHELLAGQGLSNMGGCGRHSHLHEYQANPSERLIL